MSNWIFARSSTNVRLYRWVEDDPTGTGVLYIIYNARPNVVYSYKKIPKTLFAEMRASNSLGTFIAYKIKGLFDFEQSEVVDAVNTNGLEEHK